MKWLMESDPSIRWQALRDLARASATEYMAEREKVTTEGWGAEVLSLQSPAGPWGADERNPEWVTLEALLLLHDMGVDPSTARVRRAVELVWDNVRWRGVLPQRFRRPVAP